MQIIGLLSILIAFVALVYGMVKYQQLERRYPLSDSVMPILPARQKEILALFQRCGLNAQLGG